MLMMNVFWFNDRDLNAIGHRMFKINLDSLICGGSLKQNFYSLPKFMLEIVILISDRFLIF